MSLPLIIYLKDKVLASWAINDGTDYFIEMEFKNPGDQGRTPAGQGFFYCTDNSITDPDDHSSSNMNWLQTAGVIFETPLSGFQLLSFLLLPLVDDPATGTLQIGPKLGQKTPGNGNFPNAAQLTYSFQDQPGSLPLPQSDNDNASQVNTFNVAVAMQAKSIVLFREFTPANGNGVLLTPTSTNPKFEENVNVHLIDGAGDIKGVLDDTCVGNSYWAPIDANNLYLVATLERTVDGDEQKFNVGDPRTNGTMTAGEVPAELLPRLIFRLKLWLKKLFK